MTPSASTRLVELRVSLLADIANESYNVMSDYPLATQSVTGGILSGVGDVVAQCKEMQDRGNSKDWILRVDPVRAKRFVLKGMGGGLIWYSWFNLVDPWSAALCQDVLSPFDLDESGQEGAERVVKTLSSILMEQFIACPIIYSLWDIPFPAILDGAPLTSLPRQVRNKVPGLLVENAKVWTFVNLIVYNIPLKWRVFATSCADVFWQSVISSVASNKAGELTGEAVDLIPKEGRTRDGTDVGFGYRPNRRQRQFSGSVTFSAKNKNQ